MICPNASGVAPEKVTLVYRFSMQYTPKILSAHITERKLSSFLWIQRGRYRYTFESGQFEATEGDLIYLPYGSSYTYEILTGSDTSGIQVELDILCENVPAAFAANPVPLPVAEEPELRAAMEEIVCLRKTSHAHYDFRLTADLYRLLAAFADQGTSMNSDISSRILPAIEYLEENYTRKIFIADLAARCSLSESQLRRLFQAETGISPLAYKNQLRIRAACRMLRYTYSSVGEISDAVGYENIYQFSSMFKKMLGVSPRKYTEQFKK